jgi:hypothetical protein
LRLLANSVQDIELVPCIRPKRVMCSQGCGGGGITLRETAMLSDNGERVNERIIRSLNCFVVYFPVP